MRFHTKLYLFFVVTIIFPIIVATGVAAYIYPRMATNEIRDRQKDRVLSTASLLASRSEILAAEGKALLLDQPARVNSLLSGDPAVSRAALDDIAAKTGASQVAVLDNNGKIFSQSSAAASNAEAASCVSAASISLKLNGATQGSLMISRYLDSSYQSSLLNQIGDEAALICNGQVSSSNFTEGTRFNDSLVKLDQPQPGAGLTAEASLGGQEYLTYAYTLPSVPGMSQVEIVTGETEEQVSSRLTLVAGVGVGLAAFTLVVAAILAWMVTRSISDPLNALTRAALRIEAGDFDTELDVHSKDEVGVLAATFQNMNNRIRDYIAQLKESRSRMLRAITTTTDTLGSSYDRERLLGVITESAALATHADQAFFYMIDHQGPLPDLRLAKSVPESATANQSEKFILQMVQAVATERIKGLATSRVSGRQLVVAPVAVRQGPIGALVVETAATDEPLEPGVCDILHSLAVQASTALENVELNEALQEMVITDALTGLRNVRYFNERLIAETESASRYSTNLSLIIIDLDRFKGVNDRYGHLVGDEVLRQVGKLLRENVRKSDISVRYGGEEFAIILPHTTKHTAFDVAEKLRKAAASLKIIEFPDIQVRFSAGVASFPQDAAETHELVQRADDAAYQAKKRGRNQTVEA